MCDVGGKARGAPLLYLWGDEDVGEIELILSLPMDIVVRSARAPAMEFSDLVDNERLFDPSFFRSRRSSSRSMWVFRTSFHYCAGPHSLAIRAYNNR